jgi:hypothetical protein
MLKEEAVNRRRGMKYRQSEKCNRKKQKIEGKGEKRRS